MIAGAGTGVRRNPTAGVTLIEVLVALALFALIGTAGFGVLDQVLRVQSGTEGRLDRLAELQRAMHLTSWDLMQAAGGSLTFTDGVLAFRRPGGDAGGSDEIAVSYGIEDGILVRKLSGSRSETPARQSLIGGVEAVSWTFYAPGVGWAETWPPERGTPGNPAAIALDATLGGGVLSGHLRRIAILPAEPRS